MRTQKGYSPSNDLSVPLNVNGVRDSLAADPRNNSAVLSECPAQRPVRLEAGEREARNTGAAVAVSGDDELPVSLEPDGIGERAAADLGRCDTADAKAVVERTVPR